MSEADTIWGQISGAKKNGAASGSKAPMSFAAIARQKADAPLTETVPQAPEEAARVQAALAAKARAAKAAASEPAPEAPAAPEARAPEAGEREGAAPSAEAVASGEAPPAERNETFELAFARGVAQLLAGAGEPAAVAGALPTAPLISERRLLEGGVCARAQVEALWAQKSRLDRIFDARQQALYYEARHGAFPQDRHGSERGLRNRAGDKLLEIDECVGGILQPSGLVEDPNATFIDICGGPGAWSELVLRETPLRGFGVTLNAPMTSQGETWYARLAEGGRWQALWGADGTGNVYPPANIEHVAEQLKSRRVVLAVGDGGFAISKTSGGEHMENLQELFSTRIILSELLVAVSTLCEGGNFVCKLFDTFSQLTASIIYAVGMLFEQTFVVKPRRSRVVNSERYLVGRRRRAETPESKRFVDMLRAVHASWDDDNKAVPLSIVPLEMMVADETFVKSLSECAVTLCEKQTLALAYVLDRVDELVRKRPAANNAISGAAAAAAAANDKKKKKKNKKKKAQPVVDEDGWITK